MAPVGISMLEDRAIEAALRRRARDSGADVPVNACPGMEDTALNEFKTTGLASMAFSALFSRGTGDPTDPARCRSVKPTDGMRHRLKFFRDGTTASHPTPGFLTGVRTSWTATGCSARFRSTSTKTHGTPP